MRVRVLASLCALAALVLCQGVARADVFKPLELNSNGVPAIEGASALPQQALYAHDPAVSADGRYVVFSGYIGGYAGVWRRDLSSGGVEVQPVAVGRVRPGSEECEVPTAPCDAELPSISQDGRYVSFTTAAALEPTLDHNTQPDVYVRDMAQPLSLSQMEVPTGSPCESSPDPRACPLTIVSAVDGSAEGLTYTPQNGTGTVAAGRTAISASGRQVAFVTTAASNLAGAGTPTNQVAVRDLATRRTQLVSVEYDSATGLPKVPATPVSSIEGNTEFGAFAAPEGTLFPFRRQPYVAPKSVGASISADGSTVAWMGQSVYKQARMLPGETKAIYVEPLWRRIADGPSAVTRRVTGGSEPESPKCIESGEQALPQGANPAQQSDPCQGPFAAENEGVFRPSQSGPNAVPQLSADGSSVAFLATGLLERLGQNFGHVGETTDLYLADMHSGLSRTRALRALTQATSGSWSGAAPVIDFAISADGNHVAFTTQRVQFPLGSPTYVTQPMALPAMAELFDVNLLTDSLTRVTQGYRGGQSERPHEETISGTRPYEIPADGAQSPSYSADGGLLEFSSSAANLVAGDGNTPAGNTKFLSGLADGTDVFSAMRVVSVSAPVEGYVSAAPPTPTFSPPWRLFLGVRSLPNGSVLLYVTVPASGQLSAVAASALPVAAGRAHGRRHSARARALRVQRVAASSTLAQPPLDGVVVLPLVPAPHYRSLAARRGGLSASVTVAFSAAGQAQLRGSITVSFLARTRPQARRASPHRRGR